MDIHIIDETNSIANQFISEMRDVSIQGDRLRFRKNMQRLGALMAYEFSKTLTYSSKSVQTPLGVSETTTISDKLYLMTVLRAGLPFYEGFLEIFDQIDSGFIGAYRSSEEESPEINLDYIASDHLSGKEVLLVDPMLATGNSLIKAFENMKKSAGTPSKIHLFSIIGTQSAIDNLEKNIEIPTSLWIGSVDPELNSKAYIVPGLGDAGDLSFGTKI